MNKGAKKELLIDTFDVLKDMWPAKKEAIYKVLRSMKVIDHDMMIEMWEQIIKKNDCLARQNDYNSYYIFDGLIHEMFRMGCLVEYADETFAVAAYRNKTIRKYLFSVNPQMGEQTAAVISRLLPNLPVDESRKILDEVGGRKVKENGMGEILSWVIEHLNREEDLNQEIKDFLFNYITSMSDRTERAVAYAAYLEID